MKKGFDTKKYIKIERREILKRMKRFERLYLEVGGHLAYDGHASRVLPGYRPDTKLRLLKTLGKLEIVYCVNAQDLETKKRLGDFNLNYKKQTLKDLRLFKRAGLKVDYIVITRFNGQESALKLKKLLEKKVRKVYFHNEIKNYSNTKSAIKGYKKNPVLPILFNLVIITGTASGSGKMAVAMSQIYSDLKRKIKVGYAKLETFPIYDLRADNPLNLAYEAATADLQDKTIIDPYYFKKYHKRVVNYNRDIKNFAILLKISNLFSKKKNAFGYFSPTEMGINYTKEGIINEKICEKAAIEEIKRRWKFYLKEFKKGRETRQTINRMKNILSQAKLNI